MVAVPDSTTAAQLILRTGRPVISMFGFTGSDPAMTVARLEQLVEAGELKFVSLTGGMGGGGSSGDDSDVEAWVQQNCTAVSASESGLYSCAAKTSGTGA